MDAVELVLIEDREEDAHLAMRELKKFNMANNVKWIEDGEAAVEYLQSNTVSPKLILLDLKIPKISGLEVLKVIRQSEVNGKTPVVVMSSSKEDIDIQKSYEYGVNSYVVKPMDFQKFTQTVNQICMYWMVTNIPPKD